MNNTLPTTPQPVIASSRTTQELVFDKAALARWLQHTAESTQLAYGITKHEIEPGFCRYSMDYEKMAALSEHTIEQVMSKGLLPGFDDIRTTGSGNETGMEMVIDLDAMFHAQHSKRFKVLGAPNSSDPVDATTAVGLIKKSLTFGETHLTLDGESLLRGLHGLAESSNAANDAVTKQYDAIHPFEKRKMQQPFIDKLQEIGGEMGYNFSLEGSKLKITATYDRVLEHFESNGSRDRGYMIKRNGHGGADLTIDYAQMVDKAAEQAHRFVAAHSKDGKNSVTHDAESITATLSTGALDGLWNGLVQKISEGIIKAAANYQGTIRDNIGTLAQQSKAKGN